MTEKRLKVIKVRATMEEYDSLRLLCPRSRLASWMRESCLGLDSPQKIDPKLLRQLAGIGNNLNQIARATNSDHWKTVDRIQVVSALRAIEQELKNLKERHS
jgi:hypothetical protein